MIDLEAIHLNLDALEKNARPIVNQYKGAVQDWRLETLHDYAQIALNLIARLRAAEKDAQRYQFWRKEATYRPAAMAKVLSFYETTEQLDAAIDSVIDQQCKIASGEGV